MTKCISVNQDVLRWAREVAGYTLEEVSNTYKNIIKWENGEDFPTYNQLENLAQKYKRPIAIFFFPEPPKEYQVRKSFRTIPGNKLENLNPELLKVFRKAQLLQMYLAEVNDNKNPAEKNIAKELIVNRDDLHKNIYKIRTFIDFSIEEQIKCKNSDEAFECWRRVFVDCGINVFKDAFKNDSVSGFCLYHEEFPIIYVNNSVPKNRQIFTLFHELAHILIKNNHINFERFDYIEDLNNDNRTIEIACNKFAGDFLVPDDDLRKRIYKEKINDELIKKLSDIYSVSKEVILRRLYDNKLVDKKYYLEKIQIMNSAFENSKKQKSGGGSYYNTHITYLGRPYLNMIFEKYSLNLISFENAVKYSGVSAKNFGKLEYHLYGFGGI